MRIKSIHVKDFKRFTDLRIESIPREARVVFLIGPNGSGKTCLLEALNWWHQDVVGRGWTHDEKYYAKGGAGDFRPSNQISVQFHDFTSVDKEAAGSLFYFRGAYRHDPDFTTTSFSRLTDPTTRTRMERLIQEDRSVAKNYERMVSRSVKGLYGGRKDHLSVPQLRAELVEATRQSLRNVFGDLVLEGPGDPFVDGSFFFSKGAVSGFHYKNLSGGEKSAFDLILDLILMRDYFPDAVYCIDEPEAHMYDSLQGRLLGELYGLVPDSGQLWIATHSLGMMLQARKIAEQDPESIVAIDFSDADLDASCTLTPVCISLPLWRKFLGLILGDNRPPMGPSEIVICEGSPLGKKRRDFDSKVFSRVFGSTHPDTLFLSLGSATDIEREYSLAVSFLQKALPDSKVCRLIDRDDKSQAEVDDCVKRGVRVLVRRHLESYLLDDEVLTALCRHIEKEELGEEVLRARDEAVAQSTQRGNQPDDLRSAAGEFYTAARRILGLTQAGNTSDAFLRDTLAPLITVDTAVYRELEACLFGP